MATKDEPRSSDAASSLEATKGLVDMDEKGQNPDNQDKSGSTDSGGQDPSPDDKSKTAQPEPKKEPQEDPEAKQKSDDNSEPKPEDEKGDDSGRGQDPFRLKTPLGDKHFGTADEEVKLSSFEDVQAFAKNYGMEINDVDDLQQVFKAVEDYKDKTSSLTKVKSEYDQLKQQFSSLPTDLVNLMEIAAQGGDYKTVMKTLVDESQFDFSRDFNTYDEKKMIRHFTGKNLTDDDFKEMETDTYDSLLENARLKYENAQTKHKNQAELAKTKQDAYVRKFNASVEDSIDRLRSVYPAMGDEQINRIRDLMTAGLHESLFNPDNTYKPEAAERLALQEFGNETIKQQETYIKDLVKKASNQGQTKAREQILAGSDKIPKGQRSTQDPDAGAKLQAAVERETDFLSKK